MSFAKSGDANVYYRDSGGSGPVVLLAHGFFMDSTMFDRQLDALTSAGFRVITWDARGHGQTTAPADEPFTYWDSAQDALAVLDAAGVEKAVVGGMSQGGYAALRVALLAPDRVDGLLLLDTEAAACDPQAQTGYRELFEAWCGGEVPIEALTSNLAPQLIGGHSPDTDWAPWIAKWHNSDRSAVRKAADNLIDRDSVLERLPEITAPALILRGENDQSAPEPRAAEMAEGLPNADPIVVIPDAGHAANWTHPEQVNPVLVDFLSRVYPT